MATIREGNRSVLVVVDVQVGVMRGAWEAQRVVGNVAATVEQARAKGVPVIWVQHADDELVEGSDDWQYAPELVRRPDEPLVHKNFNSSFERTPLETVLAGLGATRIVLAGMATNWCIRATAYAALERGYDLLLVSDAHTSKPLALEDGTTIGVPGLIADLNVAMTWLSYPGRVTATAETAHLAF